MSDMNSELLIKILTAYDNGGMEAAQSAMTSVTQKTEAQGAATEKVSGHWRAWTHTMHGAAQLAEGSIQGLGSALHGVSQLLGGMAGLGVGAVIGLGGAAIASVIEHWNKAKEKIEAAKQAAHDYALEQQQAGQTENLKRELEEITAITSQWEAAVAASEKYREAKARMQSAELDSKLAQLDLEEARAKEGKTKDQQADISAEYKVKRTAVTGEIGVAAAEQKHKDAQAKQEAFKQSQAAANSDQAKLDDAAAEAERERREAEAKMQAAGISSDWKPGSEQFKSAQKTASGKAAFLREDYHRENDSETGMVTFGKTQKEKAADRKKADEIEAGIDAAETLDKKKGREQEARTAAETHRKATDSLFAPDAGQAEAQDVETTRKQLQTAKLKANAGNLNAGEDLANHQESVAERQARKELTADEARLRKDKEQLKLVGQGAQPLLGAAEAEEHEAKDHLGAKGLSKAQRQRYTDQEMAGRADVNRVKNVEKAASEGNGEQLLAALHEAQKSGNSSVKEYATKMLSVVEGLSGDMAKLNARVDALKAKTETMRNDAG